MDVRISLGYKVKLEDYLKAEKLKQDKFLELFVQESNLIEGIASPTGQTFSIYDGETQQQALERSFPFFYGHKKALEYVVERASQAPPCEQDITQLHKTIMGYALADAGEFRQKPVYVRIPLEKQILFKGMPYYRQVPRLMREFVQEIDYVQRHAPDEDKLWDLHHHFVSIHPFNDGNGRTARLLLNWLSLRHLNKFVLVRNKHKQNYYDDIQMYQRDFRTLRDDISFYRDVVYDKEEFSRRRFIERLQQYDNLFTPEED